MILNFNTWFTISHSYILIYYIVSYTSILDYLVNQYNTKISQEKRNNKKIKTQNIL